MTTILVVEDEINVAKLIQTCVESEGYICHVTHNGEQGLASFRQHQPDVIILDLMLPGMNGLDVCTQIRHSTQIGHKDPYIMMLTGKTQEIDRIIGFSTGADDYMPKPFSPVELTVRLRALLRRNIRQASSPSETIDTAHLTINKDSRDVQLKHPNGALETLKLTLLEFNLLITMASRPGRIWSRAQLLELVWGDDYRGDDRIVDAYVKRLRQKLCGDRIASFDKSQFIQTAPGIGYSFADGEARA
jgi:DNA-binding response OmpR family regulator